MTQDTGCPYMHRGVYTCSFRSVAGPRRSGFGPSPACTLDFLSGIRLLGKHPSVTGSLESIMANWSNTLDIMHAQLVDLKGAGLIHKTIEDHAIDGVVHIDGQKKLNFGPVAISASRCMRASRQVHDAINRYGTQFSSSRSYLETPLYQELRL